MKGSESKIMNFMEGADKRFIIPVYQRKYDWKHEQCRQLYNDLKKIVIDNRPSHFFGSIVSSVVPDGNKVEYHIIDGQQRLTTITLLLLSIRNLISSGKIKTEQGKLDEQISQRFLISPWATENDKIKLRPVLSDRDALARLFGDEEDFNYLSNLTNNYNLFIDLLLKEEVSVDDLYTAIGKLEIISITLDSSDNAQLIFESLNSTGLALTEGDKIRNYVMMSLPADSQSSYYNKYWAKIEKCTGNDVSNFVRDYLSIKQQNTPTINTVYQSFKLYNENNQYSIDNLLEDLLRYARFFEKLLICKSNLNDKRLDDCLYRMARLEIIVTRPFFMEVLRLNQEDKINSQDVLRIFLIIESYLFRRNICEVPTNALNKIFLTLNKEILRYDNTATDYVEKLIYTLISKRESGRFPSDDEFSSDLSKKQIYKMRGKYKAYLFERFENYGTIETKDVYSHLDNNTYTIEHIMPQRITPSWIDTLGLNYSEIHEIWVHRLANLTLTAYNPNLSNKSFEEKRDSKEGGYKVSGLKMNQRISTKDSWGIQELEERNSEMLSVALKIWPYPTTNFKPAKKEFYSCTLDDEDIELSGRNIVKYSLNNVEQTASSWTDMFVDIVNFLHQRDKTILYSLTSSGSIPVALGSFISCNENDLRRALKIDENIFIERNTSTERKMVILRRLFALYNVDPMDLVFYLDDGSKGKKDAEAGLNELRIMFWTYALPIIRSQHMKFRDTFKNVNPTKSNTISGFFGISGFSINCAANYDSARVEFYFGKSDSTQNKKAYDLIFSHKDIIEKTLNISLVWERADKYKASGISYSLHDVSIANESNWERIAKFHAEWSDKLCAVILPYLQNIESNEL